MKENVKLSIKLGLIGCFLMSVTVVKAGDGGEKGIILEDHLSCFINGLKEILMLKNEGKKSRSWGW